MKKILIKIASVVFAVALPLMTIQQGHAVVNQTGSGDTLSNPVTPAQGGTGATTIPGAISALGTKVLNLAAQSLPTGGDDTSAINTLTAAAKAAGVAIYAPCGTYKHAGMITVDSIRLFGDGPCTVFESTNTTGSNPNNAINMIGTAPKLDHVKLKSDWVGTRQSNLQADAVWVGTLLSSLVTNFEVSDITIDGSAAAGIGPSYAEGGIVTRNYISNTLADSITMQNAYGHTSHITISNNNIYNSGDACVSVNSYQSGHNNGEATPVSDITVTGNICNTAVAVGMNVCGGNDVTLSGNTITNATVSAFYAESGTSFFCQAVNNVTFANNVMRSPNTGGAAVASIIVSGASGFLNTNTKILNNTMTGAKTGGIQVGDGAASGPYVISPLISGNTVNGNGESGASHQGIIVNGANNAVISLNEISNWDDEGIWTQPTANTGYLKILNNHVNQVNLGAGTTYAYLIDDTTVDELYFMGNTQKNGSSTVTGCWYVTTSTPLISAYANDCQNTTVAGGGLLYRSITQGSDTIYWEPINDSGAHQSVAVGTNALAGQTGASAAYQNTAVGQGVMASGTLTTAAQRNTGVGRAALSNLTAGSDNTAVGVSADGANTTGVDNTAVGRLANNQNNTGQDNAAFGTFAMQGTGNNNHSFDAIFGSGGASGITTASNSVGVGYGVLAAMTSGGNQVAVGHQSCATVINGTGDLCLGYTADVPTSSTSNYMNVGDMIYGDMSKGILILKGPTVVISACGGSPTLKTGSNDMSGEVTVGSAATSCTISFANTHGVAPNCAVTSHSTLAAFGYSVTTTAITATATTLSADVVTWLCAAATNTTKPVP